MATNREMREAAVAVLAKAPIPGFAKTRLIPLLGEKGAAKLQETLVDRAVATAVVADIGPVTLWCAPNAENAFFREAAPRYGIDLAVQPKGDLGERMLAAFRACGAGQRLVLIGSDCPALAPEDLKEAALLLSQADIAMAPAEDGGYGLIAAQSPYQALFERMPWGTEQIAVLTRRRAAASGLRLVELRTIWDVDTPCDFERLRDAGLIDLRDLATGRGDSEGQRG